MTLYARTIILTLVRNMKPNLFKLGRKELLLSVVLVAIVTYNVDALFFRHLFWERLLINIVITLAYATLLVAYLRIKKHKK